MGKVEGRGEAVHLITDHGKDGGKHLGPGGGGRGVGGASGLMGR